MPGTQAAQGMALGAEFSDYQYVTKAEGFLETQYKKYGAGDLSLIHISEPTRPY